MYDFLEERERCFNATTEKLGLPESLKTLPYGLLGRPYHNSHHIRSVALNAYDIARTEGIDPECTRTAFLAGACHDMGYVSHENEPQNIRNAMETFDVMAQLAQLDDSQISYGRILISNTDSTMDKEFDKQPSDNWIVHDADLCVWMDISPTEAHYLCEGIEKEMDIPTDVHSTRDFLNTVGMGTLSGRNALAKLNHQVLATRIQGKWIASL